MNRRRNSERFESDADSTDSSRGWPEPERSTDCLGRRRAGFDKVPLPAARSEAAAFLVAPERVQMSRSPMIVRTVPALRRALDSLRLKRATIALVPTMGSTP